MIEIKRLTKYYPGQKLPAVDNVNMRIEKGEFLDF